MNTQKLNPQSVIERDPATNRFGHAVVIGGSIAGLTTARVLSDHFDYVTIIERDGQPERPDFRPGAPQARHAHILPLRGQRILEDQFPGLTEELIANGAVSIDASSEMAFYIAGDWHEVRHQTALFSTTFSRPLLETTLYRRLAAQSSVHFVHDHDVVGLTVDRAGRRVTGVRLKERHDNQAKVRRMGASLVIDASGRWSRAPQWLMEWGIAPPRESLVNAFAGYASRLYRRPAGWDRWKTLYIRPTPGQSSRGGLIIPIEGDRWYVTLVGMGRDYPPTDEAGFVEFARGLPTSQFYEAIQAAEPLTKPGGFRHTENRLRHYDDLPAYLEGFLVAGDAVCTLNPVYAQGMTLSALGSVALARCLESQPEITGLAARFQRDLRKTLNALWKMAIREDQRWPATEVAEDFVRHYPNRPHFVVEQRAGVSV